MVKKTLFYEKILVDSKKMGKFAYKAYYLYKTFFNYGKQISFRL